MLELCLPTADTFGCAQQQVADAAASVNLHLPESRPQSACSMFSEHDACHTAHPSPPPPTRAASPFPAGASPVVTINAAPDVTLDDLNDLLPSPMAMFAASQSFLEGAIRDSFLEGSEGLELGFEDPGMAVEGEAHDVAIKDE